MYRIEIYYNKRGDLTLAQFEGEDEIAKRRHGHEVKKCLDSILDENIEKVYLTGKNSATIRYEGANLNLHNVHKMEKDPLMKSYLKNVERTVEEQQKKHAPKVNRTNKYKGAIVAASTILFVSLVCATLSGAKSPPEDIETPTISVSSSISDVSIEPNKPILTSTTIFESPSTEEEIIPPEENYTFLEYEDRSDEDKLHNAADLYWDAIEKYANMYGLDPELVLALATQERGTHSSKMDDGGATGLMQIQNGIWIGNEITAYNFETESYETVKVTESKIQNCETNIKIGCMILQDMIHDKDYNILAGVLSYNMGGYNVNKIIKEYSEETGLSRSQILSDQTNCDWLKHRDIITVGDRNYLQHVLSYMGNDIDTYVLKPNGERVEISIKNYEPTKSVNR